MQPGGRIAHYEILAAIGRGGMGEVWKANDTKLHREVALKTLPPEGRREQVSINGGRFPKWGLPGSGELFYVDLEGAMMAAAVVLNWFTEVRAQTR